LAEEAYGSTFNSESAAGLLDDFLLSFTSPPPDPAAVAVGVKSAETEESKTAMVWVKVPGFIEKCEPWKARRNDVPLCKNRPARRLRV